MSTNQRFVLLQWTKDKGFSWSVVPIRDVQPCEGLFAGKIVKAKWRSSRLEAKILAWDESKKNLTEGCPKFDAAVAEHVTGQASCSQDRKLMSNEETRKPPSEGRDPVKSKETRKPPSEGRDPVRSKDTRKPPSEGRDPVRSKETARKKLEARAELEWQQGFDDKTKPEANHAKSQFSATPRRSPRAPKKPRLQTPFSSEDETDSDCEYERQRKSNIKRNQAMQEALGLGPSHSALSKDIRLLKERLKVLEKSTRKLHAKVTSQEMAILALKTASTTPSPLPSVQSPLQSSDTPAVQHPASVTPLEVCKTNEASSSSNSEDIVICGQKVSRLKLAQAKMLADPAKAALKLLACLYSPEELVNGNPTGITNSKDAQRIAMITKLDGERMKYLKDYLESKWPGSSIKADIRRKLTQKCTDMYNDPKLVSLRH